LNTAHQVKETFVKNQEYLVEQGQSAPLVPEVQIKEEELEIKQEPNEAEQIEDDDFFEDQQKPKRATRKGQKKKPNK
jgi:hypothetical protein